MNLNSEQIKLIKKSKISMRDVKILSSENTTLLKQKWEETYINKNFDNSILLHKCPGCGNPIGYISYNWHIFSFDKSSYKTVKKNFINQYPYNDNIIILWEPCKWSAIELSFSLVKNINFNEHYSDDLYIFPVDMTWTFVNPHEEECGPYFSDIQIMKNVV